MDSPIHFPPGYVPEFEEEMDELASSNPAGTSEFKALRDVHSHIKNWGADEFAKKRISRESYDIFLKLVFNLELATSKIETRADCQQQLQAVSKKISEAVTEIRACTNEVKKVAPTSASYSEMLKLPGKPKMSQSSPAPSPPKVKKLQPKESVILIKPTSMDRPEKDAREEVREIIRKAIPRKSSTRVKRTVDVRNGGVLIVLDSEEDKKAVLSNKALQNPKIKVSEPQAKKPKVIIYNVPVDLEKQELIECVFSRNTKNINFNDFEKCFIPLFKVGPRGKKTVHWVVECSPSTRKSFIAMERVFVDQSSCRVKDYLSVARCFNCQGLGHVGKHCLQKNPICSHCAENHESKSCKNKDKTPCCINCRKGKRNDGHTANDSNCPSYAKAIRQLVDMTDYGL